jgi:ABC-type polar amino acid transport system ATPase subunit
MGETVAAIARYDKAHPAAKLVVKQTGDSKQHPSKIILDELKPTVTIVLVTHNLEHAARCADQVAFFYLGEMIEAGSAQQMFTAPTSPRTQAYITGRFG